jgi:hypothetical protein
MIMLNVMADICAQLKWLFLNTFWLELERVPLRAALAFRWRPVELKGALAEVTGLIFHRDRELL